MSRADKLETRGGAAKRVIETERRGQALSLRRRGHTYEEIGAELGITRQAAWKIIKRALENMVAPEVEELRKLEESRLDAILGAAFPRALAGDTQCMKIVLEVHDRRVRLMGIAPPEHHVIDVTTRTAAALDGLSEHVIDALAEELEVS